MRVRLVTPPKSTLSSEASASGLLSETPRAEDASAIRAAINDQFDVRSTWRRRDDRLQAASGSQFVRWRRVPDARMRDPNPASIKPNAPGSGVLTGVTPTGVTLNAISRSPNPALYEEPT